MNWTRDRAGGIWEAFWHEFRTDFLSRAFCGILLLFLPAALCAYARGFGNDTLGTIFFFVLGIPALLIADYFFPLVVLIDVPISANLKNAVILAALEWKCSFKLLVLTGSAALSFLFLFGPMFPLLLAGLLELIQVVICVWVNEVIDRLLGKKE